MKKFLLILCALVCGTLAFAQTYTDNLHLIVNGDDEGVKQGTVTVEFQNQEKTVLDFTLHDFSVDVYIGAWTTIDLGDITVYDIELGDVDEDGVATFSCTDDHNVDYSEAGSAYASLISDVSVNMTGDISETKLHAAMNITVTILIFGDYPVTANFGYDNDYGEYLIVNTATDNYLGGGLDYGTHATEIAKPQFFSITDQPGGYYIYGNQGGFSIGYPETGTDLYVDAVNPLAWEFIEADDGSGYYIACDDGYLTSHGSQVAVTLANTTANATVWKFVTKDEVLATMEGASISDPVDVTALIPAPEPKNGRQSLWVITGYNTTDVPANYAFGGGWETTASCAESWHSSNGFDIRQTISSLPAGYYELTAQAFYANDGGTVIPSMYITTGTSATDTNGTFENVHLPLHTTSANDMATAYQEFLEELYPVSLPFIVDEEGTDITVGFESNVEADDVMWSIFGELGLLYMGTELPELTALTDKMNVDVQAAMTAAIEAYEASKTSANFLVAEQAILDAEESVEQYEQMAAEIEKVVPSLDDAGTAVWEASDTYAAYVACELETVDEVIAGLVAAQKAQTTEGSDLSYAMENSGEWTAQSNNGLEYPISADPSVTASYNGSGWSTGDVLWKTISGLQAGTYSVAFYGAANFANQTGMSGIFLAGGAAAFANDASVSIDINYRSAGDYSESGALKEDEYHSLTNVTVDDDGVLTFGLSANTANQTGNWYLAKEVSLTLVELAEVVDYDYDVTWALANPSFEVDNVVTNLPADEDRNAYDVMDAGVTGWTLPTLSVHTEDAAFSVIDLMTSGATSTDNNFGVPGEPSDGSQMLYIRDAWQDDEDVKLTQNLTLPAGDYKITVDTKCVSSSTSKATLFVDDKSKALTIHGTSNGTDDTKTNSFLDAWDTATLTFSLDEEATVSVGIEFEFYSNGSFLLDNFKLYSVDEIEKEISWTMTEAGWGTMILPFAADVPDGLTLYAGDAITVGDTELEVDEDDAAASIVANTPYLVSGTAGSYSFSGTPENTADTYTVGVLTGTLVDLAVAKGAAFTLDGTEYLLQNQEEVDGLAFYAILEEGSAEATLDAYHCYLTSSSEPSGARGFISLPDSDDTATAIEAVESDLIANDAIYDLSGRRVAKAVKGVYIMNGKKVLVK